MFDQVSEASAKLKDGRIKAYAVTAKTRLPSLPDIPTVDEAGLPGLYINIWYGLWAPKGTAPAVIAKLDEAAVAARPIRWCKALCRTWARYAAARSGRPRSARRLAEGRDRKMVADYQSAGIKAE